MGNRRTLRLRWIQSDAQFCCGSVTERFKNRTVLQSQIYSSATYHHTRWFRLLSGPGALLKYPPKTVISITCKIFLFFCGPPPQNKNPKQSANEKNKQTNKNHHNTTSTSECATAACWLHSILSSSNPRAQQCCENQNKENKVPLQAGTLHQSCMSVRRRREGEKTLLSESRCIICPRG